MHHWHSLLLLFCGKAKQQQYEGLVSTCIYGGAESRNHIRWDQDFTLFSGENVRKTIFNLTGMLGFGTRWHGGSTLLLHQLPSFFSFSISFFYFIGALNLAKGVCFTCFHWLRKNDFWCKLSMKFTLVINAGPNIPK